MAQKQVKITEFIAVSLQFLLIIGSCLRPAVEAIQYDKCPDAMIHLVQNRTELTYTSDSHGENPCIMTFKAPMDHEIEAKCSFSLDKDCETNSFYFANDIDMPFEDWDEYCTGPENYFEGTSEFSTIALMLKSNNTASFICTLDVVPLDTCNCGVSTDGSDENLQNPSVLAIVKFDSEMIHNTSEVICTASIISHSYLLTSATCVSDVHSLENIAAFSSHYTYENKFTINDPWHWIDEIIVHPDYNPNTKLNDISLMRTEKPLEWSLRTAPICIPGISYLYEFALKNVSTFEVIGYEAKGGPLWKQNVEVIPYDDCQDSSTTQMCIKQINTDQQKVCQLGGPVIYNDKLVAITGSTDCESYAPDEQVDIATSIIPQLHWIYRVTDWDVCVAESE